MKRKVTKVISSILAVLFICMSFNGSGLTVGETKAHAESNTKTLLVGFEESISPSQSKTINIPDLSSISRMTVNNQGNVTYSVNGKDVTINVSGGLPSRTDTPTKTVSSSRTGDSSSFPSTIPYTDGGYFGTLYATGSSYVISTTTVPGDSKLAYDSRSASSVAGLPSSISYNDGVYSGTLTWESNPTYSGSMWSVTYKGTVRSASMEVKVWQQDYSGKVYGTATCYYQYSVTVIYVPVSVPTPTISLASPTPTPTHTTPTVTPTVTPTSTPTSTSTIALSPTPSPMIKALMVDPSTMTIDGLNKLGDMLKVTAIYSYGPVDVTSIVEHSSDDKSIADMDNGFVKSGTHFGTTTIRVKYLGVEGTCKVTVGYSTPIPTPTHTATPTPTKLQKPVITSPAANSIVNNGPITIKWTSVPGVDHYLFTLVNLTDNKYIAQNKNLGNTTNYPAVLEQGKRYRTCVAAANKLETDVNWAYAVEFSTSTPLPTPKITYSIADDNQVTIKWNSVPGADHYILSLVNSTNSSTQKIIVKQKTEYSLKLEAGYKYSARIAAANKDETNASWSKTVEFTMPLMLPKFAEKCLVVNGAYVNPLTAKIVNPDSLEVRSGTVCTVKVIKEKISNVSVMNAYIEKFHVNSNSGKMEIESTYKTSDWKPDGIHDFIDTSYKFNAPGTYQVYVRGWNNPQKKVGGDYAVVATNILYVTVDDTIPVVFVPGTLGCFPADECNAMVDWYKDNYDSRGMPIYCIDTPVLKQDFPRKIFNDSVNKVRNLNENNSNKISIVNGKKYYVGILDGTYDALISKLISLNYVKDKSLFLFGYDTAETSIDNNADNLKKYVDYVLKKTGAPKVNLIAHSQGTLVARKYIQESNEKKVNKFIMISPPNTGVVKSKGMLKWGDPKQYIDIPVIGTGTPPLGIQVPGLKLPTSGDLEISRYFSYYDVFSKDSKKNSSNWYYMDPENPDHPWDLKRWANKVALPVKDMAPSSNFLSSLNSPKGIESLFSSVGNGNVYVVYGKDNNKKNTVSSYNSKNEAVLGSGDNTVTLKSLSALNKYIPKNNRYIIEEGNHGNVCSNTRFLNDLSAIFK